MRRVFWRAWAVVFALIFLLILGTHFDALFTPYGIGFAWLVLTAVACAACLVRSCSGGGQLLRLSWWAPLFGVEPEALSQAGWLRRRTEPASWSRACTSGRCLGAAR